MILSFHHWNLPPRSSVFVAGKSASFVAVPASKSNPSNAATRLSGGSPFFKQSYAQVATSVIRPVLQKSCELKLDGSENRKSEIHSVRFHAGELAIVRTKAAVAEVSINSYIRAAALGSDYEPPLHEGLRKLLLATNRELTAQGNNLNQIAKHLNMGKLTPAQATSLLGSIRAPLVYALLTVKNILVQGSTRK